MGRVSLICLPVFLLLCACATERSDYIENSLILENEVSSDMEKVSSELLKYYEQRLNLEAEHLLKIVEVSCELFGKNNKKLDKELSKLIDIYQAEKARKKYDELRDKLKKSLQGVKFDLSQVVAFSQFMGRKYGEIKQRHSKQFDKYQERIKEIIEILDEQDWESDKYLLSPKDDLSFESRYFMRANLKFAIGDYGVDLFFYGDFVDEIKRFIDEGVLKDSFLENHKSPILAEDEPKLIFFWLNIFVPNFLNREGRLFDMVREAVNNPNISEYVLTDLVTTSARYLRSLLRNVHLIQEDAVEAINWLKTDESRREKNFTNYSELRSERNIITQLTDENPKQEDFDKKLDELCMRMAYKIYYDASISRFVYQKWRKNNYSKMKEFLKNSVKLADRLYDMVKVKAITDDMTERLKFAQKWRLVNIAEIKEIGRIDMNKLFPKVNRRINSQEEIREVVRIYFKQIRKYYLKNLGIDS